MTNDLLTVEVLANKGGRLRSLRSRRDEREWLIQSRFLTPGPTPAYGTLFTETDHFGWDEMFPTVDACNYPSEPFLGALVPDHGELWTLTWEVTNVSDSTLRQRVTSDHFGYTFERELRLEGAMLRCDYTCSVTSDVALALLWALHPQFEMKEGTHLLLPGQHSTVLDTSSSAVRAVPWPGDAIVERDVAVGTDRMLYVRPDDEVSEAELRDPSGSWLNLTWDRSFAPYFGIWMDHHHYTTSRVIALEPTNGFFDELSRAHREKTLRMFQPGEEVSWWVEVAVGTEETR